MLLDSAVRGRVALLLRQAVACLVAPVTASRLVAAGTRGGPQLRRSGGAAYPLLVCDHHSIEEGRTMAGCSDWIHIKGMRFHGRHGVLPEETRLGQTFVVDASLQVDTSRAGASDDLEDTVSYADVYSNIKGVVEGQPCKLLEAVAHRACATVLTEHAAVREMSLTIRKLSIPGVPSVVESVGIEVHRRR